MDYTIQNNILRVTISDKGAEIQSVLGRITDHEYMWQADPKIWPRHAPVLFPIVGRLKDNQYTYQGKSYHMTQHGFARDLTFAVMDQENESITFVLRDNEYTHKIYPFKFELQVNYKLLNNMLEENFTVINRTDGEMIFGIGGHPGFNVPVNDHVHKNDYYFSFHPSTPRIRIPLKAPYLDWDKRSLAATDSLIELSDDLFKKDALIFELKGRNKISLRTDDSKYHINVHTRTAPFVGIWSQYPKVGNFVCIEPWWGIADRLDTDGKLEDKFGMNHLQKGGQFKAGFAITFHGENN